MKTQRRTTALLTASLAVAAFALVGCAPAGGTDSTTSPNEGSETASSVRDYRPNTSELEALISQETLPKTFPTDAQDIRVVEDGKKIAATWTGPALTGSCTSSTESPGSYALSLLIQDAGLEKVQKCGDFWQAQQVDGSRVLWNNSDQA